jgi:predicted RNase H-like HicB family nuclease
MSDEIPREDQEDRRGIAVWSPGLPGCWSEGKSEVEALENIKDAITEYLAAAEELAKEEESRVVEV